MTDKEKQKRIDDLNKVIDDKVLNENEKEQLQQMNYAEQLAQEKMRTNNKLFAQDTLKANLPFVRTSGVNGMIDGVMEDNRIRKEQQGIDDARNEMRRQALERFTKSTGQSVDDILEAEGYKKDGKDGFSYGGY